MLILFDHLRDMASALQDHVYRMLQDGELTDFTCIVQGQEVKCHKVIIASRDGLLKAMVKEGKIKHDAPEKISTQSFEAILR